MVEAIGSSLVAAGLTVGWAGGVWSGLGEVKVGAGSVLSGTGVGGETV